MKKLSELNIFTERIKLIPLEYSDAKKIQKMSNHKEITEKVDILNTPFTENDAKKLLSYDNDRDECFFGVYLNENLSLVAVIGAHFADDAIIEIGYWANPNYQRKGYVSEAVKNLVINIHGTYPACQIIAECKPKNLPSLYLLEKCGFISTGKNGQRPGREVFIWENKLPI